MPVIDKVVGIADAKFKNGQIHSYVPHYTPSIQPQGILSTQLLSITPAELRYIEISVFMKEVYNHLWNFELGIQESTKVSI